MSVPCLLTLILLMGGTAGMPMGQGHRATVTQATPIYLTPDTTRTPLRTLAVHTDLRVLAEQGEWLRVEFRDPQFGPRVGYVEAKNVHVHRAGVAPPDPSVREPPAEEAAQPRQREDSRPTRPAAQSLRSRRPGVSGYASYGSTAFAATETVQAVAGSSVQPNVGGGVTITRIWRGLFLDVGVSQARLDGERVFLDEGTVYNLGIPVKVTVRPIDAAAGWRLTWGRWSPFAGVGVTSLSYREIGGFAEGGDDVKARRSGPLMLAGLDVRVVKWVQVGGEVRYRAVRGVLGEDGVSGVFGEDQVGGTSAGLRVSFGM